MSIPKEPRQQMINLMYLVLTALLALNVSAEILNAFNIVNRGIKDNITAVESKTASIYDAFKNQMEMDPEKAKDYSSLADQAKVISQEFFDYVENEKKVVIEAADDDYDVYLKTFILSNEKNLDASTRVFLEQKRGFELEKKVKETRQKFLDLFNQLPEDKKSRINIAGVQKAIPLKADFDKAKLGTEKKDWVSYNFEMVPLVASVTILSNMQNDVRSSEAIVIEELIKQIGAADFKVDQLAAKIIAPSSYVMQGQKYEADIFVAAYSSTQNPTVYLGSFDDSKIKLDSTGEFAVYKTSDPKDIPLRNWDTIPVNAGMGKYTQPAGGVGKKPYSGAVKVQNPEGGFDFYPFSGSYEVAPKTAVVSPTKMNVLYIGVPNPIEVSVPGVQGQFVNASLSGNGTISKKGDGTYEANVTKSGKVMINVSAKIEDRTESMGSKEFRVKRIPDPVPTLGGKMKGGKTQKGNLKAQSGVVPLLENFDFEARFRVVEFEMAFVSQGEVFTAKAKGPALSSQMKEFINRAKPKDIIFFDAIRVRGPDGQTRKLPSISFQII